MRRKFKKGRTMPGEIIPADQCDVCGSWDEVYLRVVDISPASEERGFVDFAFCPDCRKKYNDQDSEFMEKIKPTLRKLWEEKKRGERIREALRRRWF